MRKSSSFIRHTLLSFKLWTRAYTGAWIATLILFLAFDILWCSLTTFRALSFVQTWLFALAAAFVFSLPSAVVPRRKWVQLIVWLLLSLLFVANFIYFRTYFTAIPASSYLLAGNLADFTASITDSVGATDFILPLFSVIAYLILRKIPSTKVSLKWYGASTGVSLLIAVISSLPYGGVVRHTEYLTQQCYYTNCPPVVYSPFGKIVSDIWRNHETLKPEQLSFVTNWLDQHSSRLTTDSIQMPVRRNVVFIFLESFESWPVGLNIEGKEITPTLNLLLKDSTTFYAPNVVTQVGNGRSIDSQLLNLTGLMPMQNEVYAMSHADNMYPSLIKALKQNKPGLRSYLMSGDKATVWNQARVAQAFGIDTIIDASGWEITEKIGNPPKLSDRALFTQLVEKCRNGEIIPDGEPFFMQVVAYSSHNPFDIPQQYRVLNLKKEYPPKFREYLEAISYVDSSLKTFLDYMASRPDYHNTSIVIVGDHEGLAYYRDAMVKNPATAGMVSPAQLTPLIVVNSPKPGRFNGVMGQVDTYSTLLDILGLGNYEWQGLGWSVLKPEFPGAAVDANGNLAGNSDIEEGIKGNLLKAPAVSDLILKFDLFRLGFQSSQQEPHSPVQAE